MIQCICLNYFRKKFIQFFFYFLRRIQYNIVQLFIDIIIFQIIFVFWCRIDLFPQIQGNQPGCSCCFALMYCLRPCIQCRCYYLLIFFRPVNPIQILICIFQKSFPCCASWSCIPVLINLYSFLAVVNQLEHFRIYATSTGRIQQKHHPRKKPLFRPA